jgi:catechol 2,3-dioxygenase-like lactoylglutathione lyase family enzyme
MSFAHLTIATSDVPATAAFFTATLGWPPIVKPGNIEIEAAWLAMGPDQELHILGVPTFVASPFEREFGRHFAVRFPLAEFASLKQRLVQHGAELIAPIRPTEFERFFFRDPNGYVFEVVPSLA